jgi:hypothetical protein
MRKVIVRYSGVGADAIRQNIVSVSGVNAAVNVNVVPAAIVDMEEGREQDVKQRLASLSGVTGIEEEQQLVPMVADREYLENFLGTAEKQRGYSISLAGGDELPFYGSTQVTDSGELQDADDCLDYIGVSALHEQGYDGSNVIVANVDQGVPESQIAEERRLDGFAADGSDPWEINGGHGAYTMGIAAGGEQTDGISRGPA